MAPSTGKQYDPLEELDALDTPRPNAKSATEAKKAAEKTNEKKSANSGGSWFGGLFSKLAPKPKNQMILPDDSNPTVSTFASHPLPTCQKVAIDAFIYFLSLRACTDTFGNHFGITSKMREKRKVRSDNTTYHCDNNSKTNGKQASIRWDLLDAKIVNNN